MAAPSKAKLMALESAAQAAEAQARGRERSDSASFSGTALKQSKYQGQWRSREVTVKPTGSSPALLSWSGGKKGTNTLVLDDRCRVSYDCDGLGQFSLTLRSTATDKPIHFRKAPTGPALTKWLVIIATACPGGGGVPAHILEWAESQHRPKPPPKPAGSGQSVSAGEEEKVQSFAQGLISAPGGGGWAEFVKHLDDAPGGIQPSPRQPEGRRGSLEPMAEESESRRSTFSTVPVASGKLPVRFVGVDG
jgi:hypothetical protein